MDILHLVFVVVTTVFSATDLLLASLARKKGTLISKRLSNLLYSVAAIGITSVLAALVPTPEGFSVFISMHFAAISITTLFLLVLVLTVTGVDMTGRGGIFINICFCWTLLECILFAVNSFTGIAVSFVPNIGHTNSYSYIMRFPFYLHLAFVLLLTLGSLYHLAHRILSVPTGYKTPYVLAVSGILVVTAFSLACLLVPVGTGFTLYDFTAVGYSLTALLVYISYSRYRAVSLPNRFRNDTFESIGQGVLLFDFEGQRLLCNHRAEMLLSDDTLEKSKDLKTFCETLGVSNVPNGSTFRVSRELVRDTNAHRAVNLFTRALSDKYGKYSGQLMILTDVSTDIDPLTGFANWDSYRQHTLLNGENLPQGPSMVGAIEITGLRDINENKGREAGDKSISALATIMRREFPADVTFVRGPEAVLLAFCSGDMSDDEARTRLRACKAACDLPCVAAHARAEDATFLSKAIHDCFQTLRNKRMLDAVSSNSSSISSLISALHECDSDTESHVQRTRLTGMALADRLKLSDADKSTLNLLCLLHDIGKISIPLDILNKPGKLTENEWNIIRSHAEKGYQITSSSHDIEPIADLVLHHHERWDGKGYPDGLSGESIPLLSRIISVVDAYDAMIHDRAYRNAMPPEEAQAELRRCAGTQFDPTVVSTFLELLQDDPERFAPATKQRQEPFHMPGPVIREEETISDSEAPVNTFHMVYTRYLIDDQLNIVDIDDNFEALTGYSLDDVVNRTLSQKDLLPPEDLSAYLAIVSDDLKQKSMAYLEHRLKKKDGEIIQVFCFGRAFFDSSIRAGRSEIIVADAGNTAAARLMEKSAQNREQNRLVHWKNTYRRDSLTGLLTHTAFQNDVESVLLSGHNRTLFIMLDLDHFKTYNDSFGHQKGDHLLIQLAQALEASLRKDDLAGRMGGDEFAAIMIFDEDMPYEAITERAIQLFDKIHASLRLKGSDVKCSMGAAVSSPGDTFRDLYSKADDALYHSKEEGRNRLTFHTPVKP